jgi:hypothetical protein
MSDEPIGSWREYLGFVQRSVTDQSPERKLELYEMFDSMIDLVGDIKEVAGDITREDVKEYIQRMIGKLTNLPAKENACKETFRLTPSCSKRYPR